MIQKIFKQSFTSLEKSRFLKNKMTEVIGVATKLGQPREGPDLGPQAIREASLLNLIKEQGWSVIDHGDITLKSLPQSPNPNSNRQYLKINNSLQMGQMSEILFQTTHQITKNGNFGVVLGGDHGLATGSIAGVLKTHPDLKVIWVDAHADINTPAVSPSGNYHGMPVAHLMGLMEHGSVEGFDWLHPSLKPENLVYIGLRDIDKNEKQFIKDLGIKTFTMWEVQDLGINEVMKQTIAHLNKDGKNYPIHLSFDIDGCDPRDAPGTGTLCRGGLNWREAQYLVKKTFQTGNLVSMDLVEVNPLMDKIKENFHGDIVNKEKIGETSYLAVELILSGLGKNYH